MSDKHEHQQGWTWNKDTLSYIGNGDREIYVGKSISIPTIEIPEGLTVGPLVVNGKLVYLTRTKEEA